MVTRHVSLRPLGYGCEAERQLVIERILSRTGGLGQVIIGGNVRIYINMGIGNNYFVADRLDDEILRHAFFQK